MSDHVRPRETRQDHDYLRSCEPYETVRDQVKSSVNMLAMCDNFRPCEKGAHETRRGQIKSLLCADTSGGSSEHRSSKNTHTELVRRHNICKKNTQQTEHLPKSGRPGDTLERVKFAFMVSLWLHMGPYSGKTSPCPECLPGQKSSAFEQKTLKKQRKSANIFSRINYN